jgi:hypothetical protein
MDRERTLIERVIESLADGRPIDWAAAFSAARPEDLRLLHHLRLLATLYEAHRSAGRPAAGD